MAAPALPLLPRGVWIASYLIDGCQALVAIDSNGNCIKRVRLTTDTDEDTAYEWLEGILDHYDPLSVRPTLTLLPRSRQASIPSGAFVVMNRPHARRR